jgi:hypothetical protein
MNATQLKLVIVVFLFSVASAHAGSLCTKTETTMAGGSTYYGYYDVKFNTGDDATVDGTQCILLQTTGQEDCFPAYGEMSFENGIIELATSGSNDVTIPPYGKIIGFATRHTEIDANTKVGDSTLITTFVVGGKATQQVDTGVVTVIDCPKPTKIDRDNLKALRKFIRSTSR